MASADVILAIIKVVVLIWDFITYPIYQALYRPWEKRKGMNSIWARPVRSSVDEIVYESAELDCPTDRDLTRAKVDTMTKAWDWAVRRYGPRPLLGTRDILAEEDEVQSNGKIFKKLILGDYRWLSYEEADSAADFFGKGMRALELNPGDKVCIFADTRCEWFLAAQGCFKQGFPLVTLYTNLGEEAVVHGVNQTRVTHVITSHELLPKFRNILPHTDTVRHVVYIEDQVKSTDASGFRDGVAITPFWEVVSLGKKSPAGATAASPPTADDTAIVMYTSGSTGVPKGVLISHRNLLFTMRSAMNSMQLDARPDDIYIGFLPLAHILELAMESFMAMNGVRVGYSTPNTLIDRSSMIKRGGKGDATVLKPTVMANVPLMLDRVYKTITEALKKKGKGFEKIFWWCYKYRKAAVERGESTPILDLFVFNNLRALFGGRIRIMVCGGAPLSRETQEFTCVVMGCPVMQGYGLTETSACATMTRLAMHQTEVVGPPNVGMQIALANWEEGNYRVTDKPRPRGEILIGGPSISQGYYEMPEKTAEDFFDAHGRRWLRSGDVGQIEADGVLKIIDRKKDLVKLQFGEYVSLGKVEACLKTCAVVENVCIYGESKHSFPVALVTPDRPALSDLAGRFGKQDMDFDAMCEDKDITGAVLRELVNHGKKHRLEKFELPGAVKLCKELWTPDSGLVTAAFKLKRKPIQQFYQADLDRMYGVSRGV